MMTKSRRDDSNSYNIFCTNTGNFCENVRPRLLKTENRGMHNRGVLFCWTSVRARHFERGIKMMPKSRRDDGISYNIFCTNTGSFCENVRPGLVKTENRGMRIWGLFFCIIRGRYFERASK